MVTRKEATEPVPEPSGKGGTRFAEPPDLADGVARAAAHVGAGVPHALFVVHLERFRDVVEHCGEEAGSALLEVVYDVLEHQAAPWLCAARVAPDRLAVLKPRCLPRDALDVARRIRDALEGGTFTWEGKPFRLGVAVGVLELGGDADAAADMLQHAAEACEAARALGSDGVVACRGETIEQVALERERAWRQHLYEII